MKPKCAIYLRVSSTPQAEKGYSLEAQEDAGVKLCQRNEWEYKIFREAGKSADRETIENRPVLCKLLDEADDGKTQYCFVTELDRLSRNPAALAVIKRVFRDNNVKVVTPHQTFDFQNDEDDFMSDLLGIVARRENRRRARGCRAGLLESVKRGGWFGGVKPFGYRLVKGKDGKNRLIIDKDEAKWVRQAVAWKLEEKGTLTIARLLNDMGVKTKRTAKWQSSNVYQLLTNPVYRGVVLIDEKASKVKGRSKFTMTDEELEQLIAEGKAVRRPDLLLISKEEWEQIREAFRKNLKGSQRSTRHFYLLRLLLWCRNCGRRIVGRITKDQRLYWCSSKQPYPHKRWCGLKHIPLGNINRFIVEAVRALVKDSKKLEEAIRNRRERDFVDEAVSEAAINQLDKGVQEKDEQIKRLLKEYARGVVPQATLDETISELKQEQERLRREKQELIVRRAQIESAKKNLQHLEKYMAQVRERIDSFTEQEWFDFLHLVINRIIIGWDEQLQQHTVEIEGAIPIFDETTLTEVAQETIAERVTASSAAPYVASKSR